jgi:hypothetical protein
MDREWLDTLAGKDYLFPLDWPLSAWLINLASVPFIWVIFRKRETAGLALPRERPLVVGCLSLVAVFFAVLILNGARIALAVQLQPARIFWMLDFLAVVYAIWALAEWPGSSVRRPRLAAAALAAASVLRGAYVMRAEFPDRPMFQTGVPGDWGRLGAWAAASTAPDTGWLADPGHASDYGTSFRLSAGRDLFVEAVKDSAVGMYDRSIALRTRDRILEVGDFAALSADRARELARRHALDYLVTEHALPLPVVFEAGAIRVYSLR